MSADLKVVEFPNGNLRDIPTSLRLLADNIEAGKHGSVATCAVALSADTFKIFGYGDDSEWPSIAIMFQAGILRIASGLERHGQ